MSTFLSIHLFVTYFNTITNQFWLTLLFPLPVISLLDYSKNYPSHFFNIYWTRIINARWHAIPNVDDPLSKNTLYLPFTHIIFITAVSYNNCSKVTACNCVKNRSYYCRGPPQTTPELPDMGSDDEAERVPSGSEWNIYLHNYRLSVNHQRTR